MGLDIGNYSYSYGTIHRLREWALKVEKNETPLMCDNGQCKKCIYCNPNKIKKFHEFIYHSDCDDGYLSFSKFGINKTKNGWGNLDELKNEVLELDKHKDFLPERLKQCWEDFKNDVSDAIEILRFE